MSTAKMLSKHQWRRHMRDLLSNISEDSIRSQSQQVVALIKQLPEYEKARSIGIYMSMPGREIQLRALAEHALDSGRQVFIPYIYKVESRQDHTAEVMDMLLLKDRRDLASLQPDSWGIPSLQADGLAHRLNCFGSVGLTRGSTALDLTQGLDLIIVPAVAFDRILNRLGHGKGYYDRFFKQYEQIAIESAIGPRSPKRVGVALLEQVLPKGSSLPVNEWDYTVDALISPDGVIRPPMS